MARVVDIARVAEVVPEVRQVPVRGLGVAPPRPVPGGGGERSAGPLVPGAPAGDLLDGDPEGTGACVQAAAVAAFGHDTTLPVRAPSAPVAPRPTGSARRPGLPSPLPEAARCAGSWQVGGGVRVGSGLSGRGSCAAAHTGPPIAARAAPPDPDRPRARRARAAGSPLRRAADRGAE
ncbi:hypothetical protein GCM10025734_15680 [Kitasatospora paranensis]